MVSSNYCYRCGNVASVLTIGDDLSREYKVFEASPHDIGSIPSRKPQLNISYRMCTPQSIAFLFFLSSVLIINVFLLVVCVLWIYVHFELDAFCVNKRKFFHLDVFHHHQSQTCRIFT